MDFSQDEGEEGEEQQQHTWREEAAAVIQDIKDHVSHASISDSVCPNSDTQIHLNLTTLESQELTVRLTCEGFAVVSDTRHNCCNDICEASLKHYETLYALLNTVSKGYSQSFGMSLQSKLESLNSSN